MDGADQALRVPVVPQRSAHLFDPAGDGRLGDEAATPDRVHQLFLADNAFAVADEVDQHLEGLRLQANAFAAPTQLESIRVKFKVLDDEHHAS